MKLSKLIKELQTLKARHGDIEANIFSYDGEGETEDPYLCLCVDEDDETKVTAVTFGDREWAQAFS